MSVDLLLSMQEDSLAKLNSKVDSIDIELRGLAEKYKKLIKAHEDLQDQYEKVIERLSEVLEASENEEPITDEVNTTPLLSKRYDWGGCYEE